MRPKLGCAGLGNIGELYTAGADSCQWWHLLCDAEVTGRWRVLAFDILYHGRSTPPAGWWEREYLLTTEAYARTVMAFVRALDLTNTSSACGSIGSFTFEEDKVAWRFGRTP